MIILQSIVNDSAIIVAIIATIVTTIIGGSITAARYFFGVQVATKPEVEERIKEAKRGEDEQEEKVMKLLEKHGEKLDEIEALIMGSEYQVSDGMLEIVEMNREDIDEHEGRVEGLERIQLKIRRRQKEHSGGEAVAREEDVDPPPDFQEDNSDD